VNAPSRRWRRPEPFAARLARVAEEEVEKVRRRLPAALAERARGLPVICQDRPEPGLIDDDIDPDTLGLFVGPAVDEDPGADPIPPGIILFLGNIWDYAMDDEHAFRSEVRTTFLHELGHYLGLGEDGLRERDLE
jgi:predicted Zn-dependent protease with MMP-like domain